MSRALCLCLFALALLLPAGAGASDLVFDNTSTGPVTVTLLNPCGGEGMRLVQVPTQGSTRYTLPQCKSPDKPRPQSLRLAVFDHRTDAPGFISLLIAAKAYVRPPAKVIISRQYCEECDTRYKLAWLPLKSD